MSTKPAAGQTTQNLDKIDELYKAIGIDRLSQSVEKRCKNTNLVKSVKKLIARRHMIVHTGDMNKHRKLQRLSHKETIRRIEDLRKFVDVSDSIITDRTKFDK